MLGTGLWVRLVLAWCLVDGQGQGNGDCLGVVAAQGGAVCGGALCWRGAGVGTGSRRGIAVGVTVVRGRAVARAEVCCPRCAVPGVLCAVRWRCRSRACRGRACVDMLRTGTRDCVSRGSLTVSHHCGTPWYCGWYCGRQRLSVLSPVASGGRQAAAAGKLQAIDRCRLRPVKGAQAGGATLHRNGSQQAGVAC